MYGRGPAPSDTQVFGAYGQPFHPPRLAQSGPRADSGHARHTNPNLTGRSAGYSPLPTVDDAAPAKHWPLLHTVGNGARGARQSISGEPREPNVPTPDLATLGSDHGCLDPNLTAAASMPLSFRRSAPPDQEQLSQLTSPDDAGSEPMVGRFDGRNSGPSGPISSESRPETSLQSESGNVARPSGVAGGSVNRCEYDQIMLKRLG